MKQKILEILMKKSDLYLSGQKISEELGVSRNTVWKHIKVLKEEGFEIESIKNKGYKLINIPDNISDKLSYGLISPYLKTKFIGRKIYYYDTITSTNDEAKELVNKHNEEGWIVISEEQTMGKGRLGRQWKSPKYEGLWMSLVLRPDVPPYLAPQMTQVVAAAVVKALEELGIVSKIKWPNDIVIGNKKICGILTEMSGSIEQLNYVIVGLGLNINMDCFPKEIEDKATSLKIETGKSWNRQELAATLFNYIEKYYQYFIEGDHESYLNICREYSALLGKDIQIIRRDSIKIARAIDIDEQGALLVEIDGKLERVISGEVSIRGLYGYVE